MKGPWLLCLLPLLFPAQASNLADAVARVKPSIVAVGTLMALRAEQQRPLGTGFVVGGGTHAVTTAHVIPAELDEGRRETLAIFLPAGRGRVEMRPARVLERDRDRDLAVLRFEGSPLPALRLAADDQVREGAEVAFTGYPILNALGLYPATHRGIIAAVSPVILPLTSAKQLGPETLKTLAEPFDVYQLDATAYPGNSGSPLFEPASARVIGVINSVHVKGTKELAIKDPSGITYAIPVRHVRELLRRAGVGFSR